MFPVQVHERAVSHLSQAKVRQELLEAEAVESKKKLSRQQSESLDHMFVTYFRILKQLHDTPLLPIALKGLLL